MPGRILLAIVSSAFAHFAWAQQLPLDQLTAVENADAVSIVEEGNPMTMKVNNYTSFAPLYTVEEQYGAEAVKELDRLTTDQAKQHPEYGTIPYKTQCEECIELVDARTPESRYFVKVGTEGQTYYYQKCYGFLHYEDKEGNLRTIDPRLSPHPSQPNVFHAPNQHLPAKVDLNDNYTSIGLINGFEFRCNSSVKMYHQDGTQFTDLGEINLTYTTVGDDGAYTIDGWQDIDRTMTFTEGEIKTNYLLHTVPTLPTNEGWLIFEDHLTLPAGYAIEQDQDAEWLLTPEGNYWSGNLLIKDQTNQVVATWERPAVYDDSRTFGAQEIGYEIVSNGNDYSIRTRVLVSWLLDNNRVYPITVDPLISGSNTYNGGDINFSSYAAGNGFCGSSSNFCAATLNVTCCGTGTITNVIWAFQYNTKCVLCNAWNACYMDNAGQRMDGPCGTTPVNTNAWWSCQFPAALPSPCTFCGTCSGTQSEPFLANCLAPQCPDYSMDFTLKNIYCQQCVNVFLCTPPNCSQACHFTPNNTWTVTVEAMTLESDATANNTPVQITGSCNVSYTICANPTWGVPALSYLWNTGQTTDCFSDVQSANGTYTYTCTITDICGVTSVSTVEVVINDCVMPVELISFTGTNLDDYNLLSWITASEVNASHFDLERSTDGKDFIKLGEIRAAGNSNTERHYEFRDSDPPPGVNYYRLKQVDNDGKATWTNTISVRTMGTYNLEVYPNPAKNTVNIDFDYDRIAEGELRIVDMMGRNVLSGIWATNAGSNHFVIDMSGTSSGLYYVNFSVGGAVYKGKLLVE